jgi:hypothetical protein
MLEILVLIIMAWSALRASNRLRVQSSLFAEFGASMSVVYLAWLYPIAPIIFLGSMLRLGLLPAAALGLLCYIPALVALKKARYIFERSGTDRTRQIQDELALLFIVGIGGIVYVMASVGVRLLLAVSTPGA